MAKTVYSKEEMRRALEAGERIITAKGELAREIRKCSIMRKGARIGGGLMAVGGILAAPLTAGTSLAATGLASGAMALTMTGAAGASLTISATELAILVGGVVSIASIVKGCKKVTFNQDGSVTMEF